MKKYIGNYLCVLFIFTFFPGCLSRHSENRLSQIEKLAENAPDSALIILNSLDTATIDEEERQLYTLLLTEVRFKLYLPTPPDTIIAQAINYFHKKSDYYHEATALYYRGVTIYEKGYIQEATLYLKQAEQLAEQLDCELLRNKIYDSLEMINDNAGLFEEAIKYGQKFQKSAAILGDKELIVRGYNNMYYLFRVTKQEDSTESYTKKLISFVDNAEDTCKAIIMSNLATMCIEKKEFEEARNWIKKAEIIKVTPNQKILLGKICTESGDTTAAYNYYKSALDTDDPRFQIQAYRALSALCTEKEDYKQALFFQNQADSIKYDRAEKRQKKELAEIQLKYGATVIEKELSKRINIILAVLLLLVSALAILIYTYRKKEKAYVSLIDRNHHEITAYKEHIKYLESSNKSDFTEIALLNKQIQQLHEANSVYLGNGKKIYEMFASKQKEGQITSEDEQCFVDYYAFTYYKHYHQLVKDYDGITLRLITYLILTSGMGYTDKEFADLFCVAMTTIRSYRHRIKIAKRKS